jgi:hypothetical protein
MATSTKYDDELGLDDGSSSESCHLSDYADSKEDTESNGSSSDEDEEDGETQREYRKPRPRWSDVEEARLKAYRMEKKGWDWIAAKFGRTKIAVQQHWGVMLRRQKKFESGW